ncbi:MAG: hypothetical protein LBT86_06110 [Deltaproteobacteria bacterium]|nr:hypothetical protein [Deltaproteobacteria bacterium]
MTTVANVFHELGSRLGMGPLLFRDPGPLTLEVDNLGTLSFETSSSSNSLLVSLAIFITPYDRVTLLEALKLASLENAGQQGLRVAFHRDQILLMFKTPALSIGAPQLENLISRLFRLGETLKKIQAQ